MASIAGARGARACSRRARCSSKSSAPRGSCSSRRPSARWRASSSTPRCPASTPRRAGRRARAGRPSGDRGRRPAQARSGAGRDAGRARGGRARRDAGARSARALPACARRAHRTWRATARRRAACSPACAGTSRSSSPRASPRLRRCQREPAGAEAIAAAWLARVRDELGLPLRVGIARSKLVARLAAEEAGEGMRRVALGAEAAFLRPLPVTRLEGVGQKTASTLDGTRRAHDRRGRCARTRAARGAVRNAWPAHPRRGDRRRRPAGARGAPSPESLPRSDARGGAVRSRSAERAPATALAPARGRAAACKPSRRAG